MRHIFAEIGYTAIEEFVDRFYTKVETDPILRPLYRDDLTIPKQHLLQYLAEVMGGPDEFTENRGKPKLKFRHKPFAIGQKERDRWMQLMTEAMKESEVHNYPEIEEDILEFFAKLSTNLINNKQFTIQGV